MVADAGMPQVVERASRALLAELRDSAGRAAAASGLAGKNKDTVAQSREQELQLIRDNWGNADWRMKYIKTAVATDPTNAPEGQITNVGAQKLVRKIQAAFPYGRPHDPPPMPPPGMAPPGMPPPGMPPGPPLPPGMPPGPPPPMGPPMGPPGMPPPGMPPPGMPPPPGGQPTPGGGGLPPELARSLGGAGFPTPPPLPPPLPPGYVDPFALPGGGPPPPGWPPS